MPIITSLASYYKLDEASGNALDVFGGVTLTDTNTVTASTSGGWAWRDFENTNSEYFTVADNATHSAGDIDLSIACWVQPESLNGSGGFPAIFNKGWQAAPDANSEQVLFYDNANNRLSYAVRSATVTTQVNGTNHGALANGTPAFIVCTHDTTANQIAISVNAGTPNTAAHTTGINNGTRAFVIGASVAQSLFWDGLIRGFGFWKKVLTATEIRELYNNGAGLHYPFVPHGNLLLLGVG